MDKIRIGLIGCGAMADTHAEKFGAQKAVTDYHEILNDVDAILISLPHHLHHRVTKSRETCPIGKAYG